MTPKPKNAPVDLKWWQTQLDANGYSQNRLAQQLDILEGGMSRRVNGHLDFKAREVGSIAMAFGISLAEAMRELIDKPQRGR